MSDLRCENCKAQGGPYTTDPFEYARCIHVSNHAEISALKLDLEQSKARCEAAEAGFADMKMDRDHWQTRHRTCAEKLTSAEVRCEELEKLFIERPEDLVTCSLPDSRKIVELRQAVSALKLINFKLESDLAAARNAASQWLETANERLKELSETQAKLEEANAEYKKLMVTMMDCEDCQKISGLESKIKAQDKWIERACQLIQDLMERIELLCEDDKEIYPESYDRAKAFLDEMASDKKQSGKEG